MKGSARNRARIGGRRTDRLQEPTAPPGQILEPHEGEAARLGVTEEDGARSIPTAISWPTAAKEITEITINALRC